MSFEAYLQIEGIPGETLSEGYENWIELQDFDLSASQTASATATSAGGATSGRAYLSDLLVRKPVDNATPPNFMRLAVVENILSRCRFIYLGLAIRKLNTLR